MSSQTLRGYGSVDLPTCSCDPWGVYGDGLTVVEGHLESSTRLGQGRVLQSDTQTSQSLHTGHTTGGDSRVPIPHRVRDLR